MARYLVVDDNVAFAENLAEIIADAGDEALIAESGPRAVELAREQSFDALISDLRMPGMGGAEVVRRLRQIDAGLPAVIVTAFGADQDELARHAGILGVLPKPVSVPRLLDTIKKARRNGVVAVVDDDRALVDNLSEILRQHGFAPVTATNLAEAESLRELPLFAAIVDMRMPGAPDGEAMRRLDAAFPSLPMVVATGHADVEPPIAPSARLLKPFKPEELISQVEQLHAARATG